MGKKRALSIVIASSCKRCQFNAGNGGLLLCRKIYFWSAPSFFESGIGILFGEEIEKRTAEVLRGGFEADWGGRLRQADQI